MASTTGKNGKVHVFEVSNRAAIQTINNTSLTTVADELASHKSSLNTNAHSISNITGLQTELDNKAYTDDVNTALAAKADVFTGYTGTLTVIKTINFGAQTTTTATLNITNGIIVSIT